MNCYICGGNKYVDDHHLDCCEGMLSSETVPLCRRCHRTYHHLGVDWFDEEFVDKAIEVENKRRQILHWPSRKPLELMKRKDIKRSDSWYKKHGIKKRNRIQFAFDIRAGELVIGDKPRLI